MANFSILALTALLSAAIVPQARAQAANPEPGYCAQFYPNSDCNSIGPATPGSAKAVESAPDEAPALAAPAPAPKKKTKRKQTSAAAPAAK